MAEHRHPNAVLTRREPRETSEGAPGGHELRRMAHEAVASEPGGTGERSNERGEISELSLRTRIIAEI
jgi:hypothetical protein